MAKFNGLDKGARAAINDSFLQNMRSAKAKVTTVQEALKEFYGKDPVAKQSVINKIFAAHNPGFAELKNKRGEARGTLQDQKQQTGAKTADSSFSSSNRASGVFKKGSAS